MPLKLQRILVILFLPGLLMACTKQTDDSREFSTLSIEDSLNRTVIIPATVDRIIGSGAGALRYLTYMQCQAEVIAVDDMEKERPQFDARPYAFANPQFRELPMFGEFRGNDNPELIAALNPLPDLIFKIYSESGYHPLELQAKTGIPVVVLAYGNLGKDRSTFYRSLELIGRVMHKPERAAALEEFITGVINDLDTRTRELREPETCFIGGVAYRGPHGLQSTEPGYPPFLFLNTPNAALGPEQNELAHMDVSQEKIVEWDPEVIFIDLATFQSDPRANAFYELTHDPAYRNLRALKQGRIYGVLPYNWYTQNHGSTLANAYFIGKVLYPDRFADIDPEAKADEIYTFLVGKPVFKEMKAAFQGLVYQKLEPASDAD